jgi:hypothetical protein
LLQDGEDKHEDINFDAPFATKRKEPHKRRRRMHFDSVLESSSDDEPCDNVLSDNDYNDELSVNDKVENDAQIGHIEAVSYTDDECDVLDENEDDCVFVSGREAEAYNIQHTTYLFLINWMFLGMEIF